jgi:hypothetical protein
LPFIVCKPYGPAENTAAGLCATVPKAQLEAKRKELQNDINETERQLSELRKMRCHFKPVTCAAK